MKSNFKKELEKTEKKRVVFNSLNVCQTEISQNFNLKKVLFKPLEKILFLMI